jgi:hypothetical protein
LAIPTAVKVAREGAHLIFEHREIADVVHLALFT